jgi:hypothetical protein
MLLVELALLLLLRPILLWYLKINKALRLLASIDASLKCLPAVQASRKRMRRAS